MQMLPHPENERLTAYLLGKLSWSDVEQMETHLSSCAECRSRVGVLDGRDDSFVSCLRGVSADPADPQLANLLARARAFTQDTVLPAKPSPQPRFVAGHELRGELARGGLGVIYLAYHPLLRDLRAIKRPLPNDAIDRDHVLARFRREVEAVGSLRHDHVIRAHDAGVDADGPYLVMEYLEGEALSHLILRRPSLPVAEACELVRQAALGLQAAHDRGLVHRDVKPSNLMLARANSGTARVVVIDWGLVKWAADTPAEGLTRTGVAMGTPDFMAPEQGRDANSVDVRADVYSLGVTLYCLLAGKPPFHNQLAALKPLAHQEEPFPPLDRLRPDVPAGVLQILNKMVEKSPARRYAAPAAVAAALKPFCCPESRLVGLLDGSSKSTETWIPRPIPRRRWWRSPWLAAAAVGLLLCACTVPLGIALAVNAWIGPKENGREGSRGVLGDGPAEPVSMSDRHPGYCSSLVFMPDGLTAISDSGGGGVYLWDLQKRQLKHSWLHGFLGPDKNQTSGGDVAVSSEGGYLAVASLNPATLDFFALALYDQKTFKIVNRNFTPFNRIGAAFTFSPDGSKLAAVERPGLFGFPRGHSVHVLAVPSGDSWRKFASPTPVHSLAFAPDGKFLATACDDTSVRIRNLEANREEKEISGHGGPVSQVAYAADGKRLYTASNADGTVRVWKNDTDLGKEVKQITVGKAPAKMTCAAFWPRGRALTGHADGSVVLWDLTSGAELKRFAAREVGITAVAISPDGHHALAALADRTVYLYRLPPPAAP